MTTTADLVKTGVTDDVLIRGKRIQVISREVPQADLRFYLENPRLYSLVRSNGDEPTEEEIEERLLQMEHVKQLVQAIQVNGGLIDPVIVRGGDMVVLEGNSRLAAYRSLAKKDAVKWGRLKARILPSDISDSDVFALLGEYHIHGKTNWAPFEQAGYLYRRHKKQNISIEALSKEINLPKGQITHLIAVRDFMTEHGENEVSRWSYYDEYLKSRKIGTARTEYPEMDSLVVEKIRSGEISTAQDLRDGLKDICQASGRTLSRFVDKKTTFQQARESAEEKGASDVTVQRLEKFRKWIAEGDTRDELLDQPNRRAQFLYELEHIQKQCGRLVQALSKQS